MTNVWENVRLVGGPKHGEVASVAPGSNVLRILKRTTPAPTHWRYRPPQPEQNAGETFDEYVRRPDRPELFIYQDASVTTRAYDPMPEGERRSNEPPPAPDPSELQPVAAPKAKRVVTPKVAVPKSARKKPIAPEPPKSRRILDLD